MPTEHTEYTEIDFGPQRGLLLGERIKVEWMLQSWRGSPDRFARGQMSTPSLKALILDRDGTLIVHVPYLADPAKVELLPGVREGLRAAHDAGLKFFLHSNQSGVGRGLYSLDAVEACNRRLVELLGLGEAPFARVCIAPERPGEPSAYRKPSPAFAQEIMAEFGLAPAELCYIGDRALDLETAERAGTRAVGVATGLEDLRAEIAAANLKQTYPVFDRFDDAIRQLLRQT